MMKKEKKKIMWNYHCQKLAMCLKSALFSWSYKINKTGSWKLIGSTLILYMSQMWEKVIFMYKIMLSMFCLGKIGIRSGQINYHYFAAPPILKYSPWWFRYMFCFCFSIKQNNKYTLEVRRSQNGLIRWICNIKPLFWPITIIYIVWCFWPTSQPREISLYCQWW